MNKFNVMRKFQILKATRTFFIEKGFVEVYPSRIGNMSVVCEHLNTLFEFDYYGQKAFLSQTAQPLLEEYALHFEKTFCITPCYRKEESSDDRHLSEFWHIEAEWKTNCLEDVISMVEEYLKYLMNNVPNTIEIELPIRQIENDLISDHETKQIDKPRFNLHFPLEEKWFNFQRNLSHSNKTESADLEAPYVGEVFGLGIRSVDTKDMKMRLESKFDSNSEYGDTSIFEEYFIMKDNANSTTGGFGTGLERLMMFLFDIRRIQDTADSPTHLRDVNSIL